MQLTVAATDDPVTKAWVALHDALTDAVQVITPKELCFRLGITPQYLSDALHGKNSKGFRAEWLIHVYDLAPPDVRLAILRAQADFCRCDVERRKVLTAEQELAATRDALKRLAPAVLALVDQEIGK